MPATARQFAITEEALADAGGGAAYASLEVPGDYTAVLNGVEDYDKSASGGGQGWIFSFLVEGLRFKYWIPFSEASRWKLIRAVQAFSPSFFEDGGDVTTIDPNAFVGQTVGARVDYENDDDGNPIEGGRKIIHYIFEYVEESSDVPVL